MAPKLTSPSAQRWRLRRAQAEESDELARVQTDGWRDSFRGLMPDSVLDGPLLEQNCAVWRRMFSGAGGRFGGMGFPWLAIDAKGRTIGFSAFGPVRGSDLRHDAEVYALYVETRWQGLGVGRALMRQTAISLRLQHRHSLLLWALEANHKACSFYEHLGGQRIDRETHYFNGVSLPEIAYEWQNLTRLITGG